MAETLGTLCDKLTIVKLKRWHSDDAERNRSLDQQEMQLHAEIDQFLREAISGDIPVERLTFASNKVYQKEGNAVAASDGSIGQVFAQLADANCRLWHVQEKVYEFEAVPVEEKDAVVKQLAVLNLERVNCIDKIDEAFRQAIEAGRQRSTE
jgi:hypothetical protein